MEISSIFVAFLENMNFKRTDENGDTTEWLITWKDLSDQDSVQQTIQDAKWVPDEDLGLNLKMPGVGLYVIKKQENSS